jgi:hypothetical protein
MAGVLFGCDCVHPQKQQRAYSLSSVIISWQAIPSRPLKSKLCFYFTSSFSPRFLMYFQTNFQQEILRRVSATDTLKAFSMYRQQWIWTHKLNSFFFTYFLPCSSFILILSLPHSFPPASAFLRFLLCIKP